MSQFVTFTDIDGLVTRINPDDVVSLYLKPSDPTIAVIRLNDDSTFLSSQTLIALQALFSAAEIVALDSATLAALESITIQNPGGISAVNIQDGGNSITIDGTVGISGTVPVTGPLTDTQLRASAVPITISGTPTVNQGTSPWVTSLDATTLSALESITVQNPAGAGAVNIQDGGNSITVDGSVSITGTVTTTGLTDTQLRATPVPVSGPLTDTQLRATPVVVSGAVTVSDGSGPLTVDGTVAISGSVAVTGPLTDAQLRATPVPVSGTVTVTDGSGPITVDGTVSATQGTSPWVVSGPLTDTQLRASAVPVSGPLTDTQLRATPVPVSGTVTADTELPAATVLADGDGNPTTSRIGANNLVFNGTTWDRVKSGTATGSILVNNPTAANLKADVSGSSITIEALTFAEDKVDVSGSSVTIEALTFAEDKIDVSGSAVSVTGTVAVTQSTSPWVTSVSGSVAVTGPLTDAQLRASAVPVSGTVTANQGTSPWVTSVSGSVAVTGPLTDTQLRATPVPVSGSVTIEALTFAEDKIDVSGSSVSITGTVPVSGPLTDAQLRATSVPVTIEALTFAEDKIDVSGSSISVTGTVGVTQSTSPWVVSGPLTDTQLRASAVPVSGPLTDTQLRATPVPVSGTVTVTDGSGPLTVDGTVAATQSGAWSVTNLNGAGAAAVNIQDGGNSITVDGTVGVSGTVAVTQSTSPWVVSGTVIADTELPAATALADGDGNPTTSRVGSNTLVFNGTTWDRAKSGTAAGSLLVNNSTAANLLATVTVDAASLAALESTTIQNPSGAGAVNIQDGGNSITVDGAVSISGTVAVTQSTTPWVVSQQSGTITNGAETAVSSSAVLILATNANRKKYIVQNTGSANIRVGTTGVTATTGARILPNGTLLFEMPNCPTQDIYAIREGTVDSIAFAEEIT